jgi:hypothetical protein
VTPAGQPLPCGLATASCASMSGLTACIDDYFANDGACGTGVPLETFPTFTALPPPKRFRRSQRYHRRTTMRQTAFARALRVRGRRQRCASRWTPTGRC